MEGVVAEPIDVGDAFECLHGCLLLMGTKKPAGWAGTRGAEGGSSRSQLVTEGLV